MPHLTCVKCGSTDIIPDVQIFDYGQANDGQLKVILHEKPEAWLFKGSYLTPLKAWICGQCGFVELYVANPAELLAAYKRSRNEEA